LNYTGGGKPKDGSADYYTTAIVNGEPTRVPVTRGKTEQVGPARRIGKQNLLQRIGKLFGKHKKASIAAASGGLIGGTMAIFGGMMSGPMSIVHTGEFVGRIADALHDSIGITRLVRDVAKGTRIASTVANAKTAVKNSRVGRAATVMSRAYEQTLKKTGMEIIKDSSGKMVGIALREGTSARNIQKLKKAGKFGEEVTLLGRTVLPFAEGAKGVDKFKSMNSALKVGAKMQIGAKLIEKTGKVGSIVSRIIGVVNKLRDFHPIKLLTGIIRTKVAGSAIGKGTIQIGKMLGNFAKNRALGIAERAGASIAGQAAKKLAETIGEKLAKVAANTVFKGITKVLGFTGPGAIIGFAVGFAFELFIRRLEYVSFEANLNIAGGYAGEVQSWSDQIKSGDFPTETKYPDDAKWSEITVGIPLPENPEEEYEPGEPMQEAGLFVEANLYSETPVMAENSACSYIRPPADNDDEEKYQEEHDKYLDDVNACIDNLDDDEADQVWGESSVSNFWDCVMVNHETDPKNPLYQQRGLYINQAITPDGKLVDIDEDTPAPAGSKNFVGDVPYQLISDNYSPDDGWAGDVINAAIAALPYNFVGAAPDMFENKDGALDTTTATPRTKGCIAVVGAKALSNTKLLTAGGYSYAEGSDEAKEMETARRQFVQDEFNAKPLLARLFDVSDYQSAVVTLAHNSGWDTSNSSIGTQLKNVAKTFALLPNLIISSLNKVSYASAATNSSDFYGFGTVGYTEAQLDAMPDYDVAADGVIEYHSDIKPDQLSRLGIEEISTNGRVKYREDTNAKDLDVSAKNSNEIASGEHGVTLCDNDDIDYTFVWDDNDDPDKSVEECFSGNTVYGESYERDADGKIMLDDDGDEIMVENTNIVIAGHTSYTTDQMVRTYLLDYPQIMAAAADGYRELCDDIEDAADKAACKNEKDEASTYLDEAMQDMGVMTGSENTSTASSEFNPDTIQDDFAATGGVYDGVNLQQGQCALIPRWFIGEYTNLEYVTGAGSKLADNIAAHNSNRNGNGIIETSAIPVAPAIFGSCVMGASGTKGVCKNTRCGDGICGHTGLVIKVNGDNITTLETYSGMAGKPPYSYKKTYNINDYPDTRYLNLGAYLK
jgi:hypothetical protein